MLLQPGSPPSDQRGFWFDGLASRRLLGGGQMEPGLFADEIWIEPIRPGGKPSLLIGFDLSEQPAGSAACAPRSFLAEFEGLDGQSIGCLEFEFVACLKGRAI